MNGDNTMRPFPPHRQIRCEDQPGDGILADVAAGLVLPNRYQADRGDPTMVGAPAPTAPTTIRTAVPTAVPPTGGAPAIGVSVRPLVMTLCGSMRFYRQMLAVAAELTTDGVIVLAPFLAVAPAAQTGTRAEVKARLDRLHRDKIDLSGAVIVVSDPSGYYGDSTAAEIAYAQATGRSVWYRRLSDADARALVADLAGDTDPGTDAGGGCCCGAARHAALVANGWHDDTIASDYDFNALGGGRW